eukprot:scaffold36451_cov67-Phaeocystis_antarctica.AAC.2
MSCRAVQGGDRMESAGRRQGERAGNAKNTHAHSDTSACTAVAVLKPIGAGGVCKQLLRPWISHVSTSRTSPARHFSIGSPLQDRGHFTPYVEGGAREQGWQSRCGTQPAAADFQSRCDVIGSPLLAGGWDV